jgi:hypothetical protein
MNLFRSIAFVFAVALLQDATLAQEASKLSEIERLRWELAAARSQLHAALAEREGCRVQLVPVRGAEVRAEIARLKVDVEASHDCATKGCVFDVEKGILVFKPQAETEKRE